MKKNFASALVPGCIIVAGALAVVLRAHDIGSRSGLLATAILTALLVLLRSGSARITALTIVAAGLFSWYSLCASCFYGEEWARSWWPWLAVQPLTTLVFIFTLLVLLAVSDEDLMAFRPATAITAATLAAFYGIGRDYGVTTQRPWAFDIIVLVGPGLLALVPRERWPQFAARLYALAEPFVMAFVAWLALAPVLNERESKAYFLFAWFWYTFAFPAALALAVRFAATLRISRRA